MNPAAFWLTAPPLGFSAICAEEQSRMRWTRAAWLLSSGEIMRPRNWQDEKDFAKPPQPVQVEAA